MTVDTRPAWMTPILYNDAPSPGPIVQDEDDSPIDYGRSAERERAFDDDLEDEEEGGDES